MPRMHHEQDFCSWLRRARVAADLTQEALAEAVGCAAQTLRAFESGRRRPSREMALRIASALELPAEERDAFLRLARLRKPSPGRATAAAEPSLVDAARQDDYVPPPDALIGRHALLEQVRRTVLEEQRRLVTLLGPGGIGKTRLALHAAADLAGHFADGVAFVGLTAAATADEAVTAIASAVGCPLLGATSPETALLAFLRPRAQLLVLDNLEQLLASEHGDRLGQLLSGIAHEAAGVRVLVTSRERLRLRAEWVIEVTGLTLPADDGAQPIERSEAVLLFLERARQVSDSFALTPDNRAAVARICRLLGGVPLAIELAAAWTRTLSCQEIAEEVERSIDFLTLEERDRPSRHRSLRAVIDHSWRLLSPAERRLLARMSVFRGGCRRDELVPVVAAAGGAQALSREAQLAALRGVASLVDKSLARRTLDRRGETRYDLHELVRQYAADALQRDQDEYAEARERHCAAYAALLERHEPSLRGAGQAEALALLADEIDNLRSAWQWAIARGDAARVTQMLEPLWQFYEGRGWFQEAAATFTQSAEAWRAAIAQTGRDEAEDGFVYGALLAVQGWFAYRVGRLTDAQAALAQSVERLRPFGERRALAHALSFLGVTRLYAGDHSGARAACEESAALYRALGYEWGWAYCRGTLGVIAGAVGQADEGVAHWRAALDVYRTLGDARLTAMSLNFLGAAVAAAGDEREAERLLSEALALGRSIDDPLIVAFALLELGRLSARHASYDAAQAQFAESLALFRTLGDRQRVALVLSHLGQVALEQDSYAEAQRQYTESYLAAAGARSAPGLLGALAGFAALLQRRGAHAEALQLANMVRRHPAATAELRARMDELAAASAAQLPAHGAEAEVGRLHLELLDDIAAAAGGGLPLWLERVLAA